jgi:ABC-type uncharacterized transport system ATPase subunit
VRGAAALARESAPGAIGVEALGVSKRFGTLKALDDVSMKVVPGSFHALLGENGAGKSTLVKCIMGYYRQDEGQLIVDGREAVIGSPREAHLLGLGMVYQHFTLVPNMTVAENLVLVRPDLPAIVDWGRERASLEAFMQRMPFRIELDRPASALAAGEKQKVEILKQLYLDRRFLILDEPTSVLTPGEADEVLGLLHGMTRENRLTILMITHKFREVMAFADEVTVLRRGRFAGAGRVGDLDADSMARMMMGSDQPITRPVTSRRQMALRERLTIDGLTVESDAGTPAVRDATLAVRTGEIVGIAGVSGNGQRELVEALAGQRTPSAGAIRVDGEVYRGTREETRRHKLFCLPEEPLRNACVGQMSVAENMALRSFDRPPYVRGGWWTVPAALRETARQLVDRYRVRTPGVDAPVRALSGGNIQRVVLARELSGDVRVLVVANPVFGLDFKAVADIHAQILAVRDAGAAVLLVSEDLDELFELADRIVVMSGGRFVYETPIAAAETATIGRYMAGH